MATASFDAGAAAAPVWKDKKRYLWMLGLVIPVTPLIGLALQHETGWSGWLWMAKATLAGSPTPWDDFVDDYDRIRDVMAGVFPGFENFNQVVRQTNGFLIAQPARERTFLTPSGRMEFSHAALPDVVPADAETLVLQTMRSHDQWNTTIYSNNDRYRGVKNLRELIFMNAEDMAARARAGRLRRHHLHLARRLAAAPHELPGARLRPAARQRRGLHAGDERADRHRRLQHAERPAADEERQGHRHARLTAGLSRRSPR